VSLLLLFQAVVQQTSADPTPQALREDWRDPPWSPRHSGAYPSVRLRPLWPPRRQH
jgi:hypothetical protein